MPVKKFSDRILSPEKESGYDFEVFVFEALAKELNEWQLTRRIGRGRDGAIDLIYSEGANSTIFECKYVGDLSAKTARQRWKEVEKNLRDNLTTIQKEPSKFPKSQYRLWLDQQFPISNYIFCTSAILSNLDSENLKKI